MREEAHADIQQNTKSKGNRDELNTLTKQARATDPHARIYAAIKALQERKIYAGKFKNLWRYADDRNRQKRTPSWQAGGFR